MCLDGAMHYRQAESGTTDFGRHERLEQSLFDGIGYTATLIGDLQHHRAPGEALGLRWELVVRELRRLESDFSAGRRCLHCIEKQVENRTMEQVVIANDDQWC